jgi:hypothetical protein
MPLKKIYTTDVQNYTGKKQTNHSYSDIVQVNVPLWHRVLNKVQNWAGTDKKPRDPYTDPRVIRNFTGE